MLRFDFGDNSSNINSCSHQLTSTLTIVLSPYVFYFCCIFSKLQKQPRAKNRKSIFVSSCSSYHRTPSRKQFYSCLLQSPSDAFIMFKFQQQICGLSVVLLSHCKLNRHGNCNLEQVFFNVTGYGRFYDIDVFMLRCRYLNNDKLFLQSEVEMWLIPQILI